jgi:hypothetical protein
MLEKLKRYLSEWIAFSKCARTGHKPCSKVSRGYCLRPFAEEHGLAFLSRDVALYFKETIVKCLWCGTVLSVTYKTLDHLQNEHTVIDHLQGFFSDTERYEKLGEDGVLWR